MRRNAFFVLVVAAGACDENPTSSKASMLGEWRSTEAHVDVAANGTLIRFRDGSCYGSFAVSPAPVPPGDFTLNGVFTQLMGVAPGRLDYPATFTGSATAGRIVITMNVPSLDRTAGPLTLSPGTGPPLNACLYP
jgi:hypothetical protein